jgi:hypothetical protein
MVTSALPSDGATQFRGAQQLLALMLSALLQQRGEFRQVVDGDIETRPPSRRCQCELIS